MQAKLHIEKSSNVDPPFEWGVKRGVGGAKRDVQFYESCTYDEVTYTLYDNVYILKDDEIEPYIGKIVKMWEQGDGKKKVKILWFFLPNEVLNYLKDENVLENEIFLASGEGVGLANINPLEVISGKCSVICTSEDARNSQPSKDALERAEFIFYRTFDVGTFAISDKLPDKIAGLEVESLLNHKEDQVTGLPKSEADGSDIRGKASAGAQPLTQRSSETIKIENRKKFDETRQSTVPPKIEVIKKNMQNESMLQLGGKNDQKPKVEPSSNAGKASKSASHDAKVSSIKHKANSDLSSDKPTKKIRLGDGSVKPDDLQISKHATGDKKVASDSVKDESAKVPIQLPKMPIENRTNPSKELAQRAPQATTVKQDTKTGNQIQEVTRRPDVDRTKWFKELSWGTRLQKAHKQGTLVLLQNFDRSFTSGDIEDIIYLTFNQRCAAKVFPLSPPYGDPHHGQAYAIFKARDAADAVIQKINSACLLLPNGRPLMASSGMLSIPSKASTHVGHLAIKKFRMMQREEKEKAVSTSHCSQPNTIEYEMAMDWILVHEKTASCFDLLYKWQGDDRKKVKRNLKTPTK